MTSSVRVREGSYLRAQTVWRCWYRHLCHRQDAKGVGEDRAGYAFGGKEAGEGKKVATAKEVAATKQEIRSRRQLRPTEGGLQ